MTKSKLVIRTNYPPAKNFTFIYNSKIFHLSDYGLEILKSTMHTEYIGSIKYLYILCNTEEFKRNFINDTRRLLKNIA